MRWSTPEHARNATAGKQEQLSASDSMRCDYNTETFFVLSFFSPRGVYVKGWVSGYSPVIANVNDGGNEVKKKKKEMLKIYLCAVRNAKLQRMR